MRFFAIRCAGLLGGQLVVGPREQRHELCPTLRSAERTTRSTLAVPSSQHSPRARKRRHTRNRVAALEAQSSRAIYSPRTNATTSSISLFVNFFLYDFIFVPGTPLTTADWIFDFPRPDSPVTPSFRPNAVSPLAFKRNEMGKSRGGGVGRAARERGRCAGGVRPGVDWGLSLGERRHRERKAGREPQRGASGGKTHARRDEPGQSRRASTGPAQSVQGTAEKSRSCPVAGRRRLRAACSGVRPRRCTAAIVSVRMSGPVLRIRTPRSQIGALGAGAWRP